MSITLKQLAVSTIFALSATTAFATVREEETPKPPKQQPVSTQQQGQAQGQAQLQGQGQAQQTTVTVAPVVAPVINANPIAGATSNSTGGNAGIEQEIKIGATTANGGTGTATVGNVAGGNVGNVAGGSVTGNTLKTGDSISGSNSTSNSNSTGGNVEQTVTGVQGDVKGGTSTATGVAGDVKGGTANAAGGTSNVSGVTGTQANQTTVTPTQNTTYSPTTIQNYRNFTAANAPYVAAAVDGCLAVTGISLSASFMGGEAGSLTLAKNEANFIEQCGAFKSSLQLFAMAGDDVQKQAFALNLFVESIKKYAEPAMLKTVKQINDYVEANPDAEEPASVMALFGAKAFKKKAPVAPAAAATQAPLIGTLNVNAVSTSDADAKGGSSKATVAAPAAAVAAPAAPASAPAAAPAAKKATPAKAAAATPAPAAKATATAISAVKM